MFLGQPCCICIKKDNFDQFCPKLFPPSQEGLIDDLYLSLRGANSNILTPEIQVFSPANQIRFYFIVLNRALKHIPR